ncbi:hypothetical protein ASZ90_010484 [hydrocarbon metagenome]|uniref:Uncharacterized protein n=1 Tax=hydrocarbon metagenome TaxID=938273 RepID=A0A0W8FG20_9ZZZZ
MTPAAVYVPEPIYLAGGCPLQSDLPGKRQPETEGERRGKGGTPPLRAIAIIAYPPHACGYLSSRED